MQIPLYCCRVTSSKIHTFRESELGFMISQKRNDGRKYRFIFKARGPNLKQKRVQLIVIHSCRCMKEILSLAIAQSRNRSTNSRPECPSLLSKLGIWARLHWLFCYCCFLFEVIIVVEVDIPLAKMRLVNLFSMFTSRCHISQSPSYQTSGYPFMSMVMYAVYASIVYQVHALLRWSQ